jgi:hypothetical protein
VIDCRENRICDRIAPGCGEIFSAIEGVVLSIQAFDLGNHVCPPPEATHMPSLLWIDYVKPIMKTRWSDVLQFLCRDFERIAAFV